jgi:hypothetical protein
MITRWTKYNWEDKSSHPPKVGRYLVYRQGCDKVHFAKWNGSGWAYDNDTITDWSKITKPSLVDIKENITNEKEIAHIFLDFANDGNEWDSHLMGYTDFIKAARKLEELINKKQNGKTIKKH